MLGAPVGSSTAEISKDKNPYMKEVSFETQADACVSLFIIQKHSIGGLLQDCMELAAVKSMGSFCFNYQ